MPVEIPVSRVYAALVDEADAELCGRYRWAIDQRSDGRRYAIASTNKSSIRMHRLLVSAPKGLHIDHRGGDGLNNQRDNLRIATAGQNNFSHPRPEGQRFNKHGFRGVAYITNSKVFIGRLAASGKHHYTKCFATPIEAAIAWDELALKHYGEFATLNFPDLRSAA